MPLILTAEEQHALGALRQVTHHTSLTVLYFRNSHYCQRPTADAIDAVVKTARARHRRPNWPAAILRAVRTTPALATTQPR